MRAVRQHALRTANDLYAVRELLAQAPETVAQLTLFPRGNTPLSKQTCLVCQRNVELPASSGGLVRRRDLEVELFFFNLRLALGGEVVVREHPVLCRARCRFDLRAAFSRSARIPCTNMLLF